MTGFILPELIIESLIRDGIENARAKPEIIDDVFSQLTRAYNSRKYGAAEVAKIKEMVKKEIAVVYAYHQLDAKPVTISIMIGTDDEDKPRARLGDYEEGLEVQIADPAKLEALVRVENMDVTGFDPTTGKVSVSDITDLSTVYKGMIYVDSAEIEHVLSGGIDNTPGSKGFFINKQDDVDFSDQTGLIKSSLNYEEFEVRGVTGSVNLVLGVHTKNELMTKYFYILLKYWILSRKQDMIKRGLFLASYSGSDFHRDAEYIADKVSTRFLTITGRIEDTWRSDQVTLIDNIEIDCEPVE